MRKRLLAGLLTLALLLSMTPTAFAAEDGPGIGSAAASNENTTPAANTQDTTAGDVGSATAEDETGAGIDTHSVSALQAEIDAAAAGNTVTLTADETADITISKDLTLDLDTHTLTNTNAGKATITVTDGAVVTVKNGSVVGGTGYYNIQVGTAVNSTADLTLEDVTATAGNTGSSMIDNWGTLTITSGTYTGGLNVVKSEEGSTLTISGGTFTLEKAGSYTAVVLSAGKTLITDGEFIQSATGRWENSYPVVVRVVDGYESFTQITGGKFINKSGAPRASGVWAYGSAGVENLQISGGTFDKRDKSTFSKFIAEGYSVDAKTGEIKTAATGATLNKSELTLKAGLSETLTATVSPESAEIQTVTWTSSNEKIAKVLSTGKVTGYSEGTAIITATPAGSKTGVSCTVTVTMGDAAVGDKQYATLADAISKGMTTSGKTVTLLTDVTESVTFPNIKRNYTLNLNGHTITNDGGDTITVGAKATLTITGEGTVDNVTNGKAAIVNNGTLTLNGGTYTRSPENPENNKDSGGGNSFYTILNDKGGKLTINDGVTVTNVGHFSSMIRNGGNDPSTLTINGGTFSGGVNTVKNDVYGELTITGGDFSNTSQYVIMNWNKAKISGGTFEANANAEAVLFSALLDAECAVGELTITGGTFKGADGQAMIDNRYDASHIGSATVSGGTFTADVTGFLADGFGSYKNAVDDGFYRVGVKQDVAAVTADQIGGKTEDNAAVIETALASINANTAANNFAGTGADGVEVKAGVKADLTQQAGTTVDETAIITTISVTPTAMTVDKDAKVTNVTFDVKPIAKVTAGGTTYTAVIPNDDIAKPLTFRLPIPFEAATTVKVKHNGDNFGTYNVLGETGHRYIELSSKSFSLWTVENTTGFTDQDIVAKTATQQFTSLAAALNAAVDGDTVTVLQNCTMPQRDLQGKNITLDLNNHTVTAESEFAFVLKWGKLTVKNGSVAGKDIPFAVYGSPLDNAGADYSVLTLNGVNVTADNLAVAVFGVNFEPWNPKNTIEGAYGAVVNVNNSNLTAPSGMTILGSVQGTTGNVPRFNIANSTIAAKAGIGIYGAGYAAWTINGGTITGDTAIYAKAGTFDITGTDITGTGDYAEPTDRGNGADATGDAIVMDTNTGYAGNMTLKLTNSTVKSEQGSAVREAVTKGTDSAAKTIEISGGTFAAAKDKGAVKTSEAFDRSDSTTLTVSGTPTGVTAQDKLGQFTKFSIGDGGLNPEIAAFENCNGGDAGMIELADFRNDQKLTANFEVTMGTVSYSVDGGATFTTIQSGDELTGYQPDTQIIFQIECGSTVTNRFTLTPHWASVAADYTLTVKPQSDANFTAGSEVKYDVYVSGDAVSVGSYDFTLTYPTEYFEYVSYSVTGAEVNSTTAGSAKIAAKDDAGITPTAAGTLLGTVTLRAKSAHVDGKDTITIGVADGAVVTPKGYNNNGGTITTAAHEQYYINFQYVGCTNENYSKWFTKDAPVTAEDPQPKTGWSAGTWGNDFVSGTTTATAPATYTYTATHNEYTVSWDETNNPMTVKKADGTEVTNGGKVFYEDALTITATAPAGNKVIRDGDFKYTLEGTTGTGLSRNGESGYAYTIPAGTIDKNVTLSYTTTEYVTVTFDGNGMADLKVGSATGADATALTAYTLKAQAAGDADKLYASVNDFIKGASGTTFAIPFQVAKEGYRLVPPEAKVNFDAQKWADGTSEYVNATLNAANPSYEFSADTTLTPVAVAVYKVTFTAGSNGAIKSGETAEWNVDAGTTIEDILAGAAKDYTTGAADGTPITVPATTPADGYMFKAWTPTTGTVNAAATITAGFEQAWYSISVSGDAQLKEVSGFTSGKISWSSDVTFKLNAKDGTRITKVTYTVAPNANGTAFAGKTGELTAVSGVYTLPKGDIYGDVTIAVESEETVKVTVQASTDAHGYISGTTSFIVKKGERTLDTTGLVTNPDAGYEWDGKFYTDEACTTERASDAAFGADTTLYVKFVNATYSFTKDEGVTVTGGLTNGTTGDATHGTDITFTVSDTDTGVISKVTYTVGGGAERELTPDADGRYTIPGSAITGDIKVIVKTLAQEAGLSDTLKISFILRDSTQTGVEGSGAYMANVAQNTGMKIMLLSGTTDGSKFFRLDNGKQMYWSSKYQAYVCWVPASTTAAGMTGRISYVDGKTPLAIKYDGDLNFDSAVNSADAGIVNDALLGMRLVPTSALQLFEMDVEGDDKTIDANDVTWILKKTVGSN